METKQRSLYTIVVFALSHNHSSLHKDALPFTLTTSRSKPYNQNLISIFTALITSATYHRHLSTFQDLQLVKNMCRTYLTNYSQTCGHRFTSPKIPCYYESHRDDCQPVCRFITTCYLRWDENGETHCEDCRAEIRKARPGRILAAKREQLETYELGIAEYIRDIDEQEAEFQRMEAEEDSFLEALPTQSEAELEDVERATTLADESFEREQSSFEKDLIPCLPAIKETSEERELSPYEKELLNYQDIEAWIQSIKGDWQEGWIELNIKLVKAQTKPLSADLESDRTWENERRARQVELARKFSEAQGRAEKKVRDGRLAKLTSMFAAARAKAPLI